MQFGKISHQDDHKRDSPHDAQHHAAEGWEREFVRPDTPAATHVAKSRHDVLADACRTEVSLIVSCVVWSFPVRSVYRPGRL